ncbi:MAG: hypothetical protein HC900_00920 [Methylacidiphilales bacterium]|nr:hypothetical protein [Candidatus Methylacidiphilales bacterium]
MAYVHGRRSGWEEYRYGVRRPITLAGPKPKQIIRGDKRAHVVDEVAALLKKFHATAFEFEGACVHNLRAELCLSGHRWALADIEASTIVAEALRRIGAERPSWAEGQPDYAPGPDYCRWCARPIDDEDLARGRMFCSAECGKAYWTHRNFEDGWRNDKVGMQARMLLDESRRPVRTCERCGKQYQSRAQTSRFCSKACSDAAIRVLPDRDCKMCGATFRPRNSNSEYCSPKCRDEAKRFKQFETVCQVCGTFFISKKRGSMYCSDRCKKVAFRARGREAPPLAPAASGFICELVAAE